MRTVSSGFVLLTVILTEEDCLRMPANHDIGQVIAHNRHALRRPGVLAVRPGYKMVTGWITRKRAIVVTVDAKTDDVAPADRLPAKIGGYAVDVRQASPLKKLQVLEPVRYAEVVAATGPQAELPHLSDELAMTAQGLVAVAPTIVELEAAKPQLDYTAPAGASLDPIEADVSLICHASPDAGWPTLAPFLAGTKDSLIVGLYDFTSAHILSAVTTDIAGKSVELVLDHPPTNPTADQSDEDTVAVLKSSIGDGLEFAWALERNDRLADAWIFPNAYHIKVVVRDHEAVWLSSGNWNNSNQPDIDPVNRPDDRPRARSFDRDWHVIVRNPHLAATFEAYLRNDLNVAKNHQAPPIALAAAALGLESFALEEAELEGFAALGFAEFFAPKEFAGTMKLRPLLTPDLDVYASAIIELLLSANRSLYMQTQYIHPSNDANLTKLINALIDRQRAGVDVRLIMSQWEKAEYLELLQAAGIDLTMVRIQHGVHNKGIVIDSEVVLVSSQNWSGDGVSRNRDAGLLVYDRDVAQYYERIFIHDWTNLAIQQAME
jgi:hypothetical protein